MMVREDMCFKFNIKLMYFSNSCSASVVIKFDKISNEDKAMW